MDQQPGTFAESNPVITGTILLVITAVIGICAWFVRDGTNWLVVLLLIVAFFLITGKAITGRALGILVNERNLMSLSRLQMIIWTAIIVSGFLVIAIVRIRSGEVDQPLSIGVDWQIWVLLGISTTSLVGTPLLYGNKKAEQPKDKDEVVQKAAENAGVDPKVVDENRQGILYANPDIRLASFTDLFQGDELVNAHLVDMGKLQMFFFTVAIGLAYAVQLYQLIAYGDLTQSNVKLPELQDGLLALMGVSHAGYLGSHGVTQTPTVGG